MEKKEIKPGIFELENGNFEVQTKDGIFELADVEWKKIDSAMKRGNGSLATILSAYIIKKDGKEGIVGELEIEKYKGSTIMKLQNICFEKFGMGESMDNFLSKQGNQ